MIRIIRVPLHLYPLLITPMDSPLDWLVEEFGYSSYEDYIKSATWKTFKEKYKNSGLPQVCAHCDNPRYQLHHITYERICREELDDVIPLCGRCHMAEHGIIKKEKIKFCKRCKAKRIRGSRCPCRLKVCLGCDRLISKENKKSVCHDCLEKSHLHNTDSRSICCVCGLERFPNYICKCLKTPKKKIVKQKQNKEKKKRMKPQKVIPPVKPKGASTLNVRHLSKTNLSS